MIVHLHTPTFFPRLVGMTYAADVRATLLSELGAKVTVIAAADSELDQTASRPYAVRRFDISGSGLPWNPIRGDVDRLLTFTRQERPDIVISEGWFTPGTHLLPRMQGMARHLVLASHGSADTRLSGTNLPLLGRTAAYRANEFFSVPSVLAVLSAAIILTEFRGDVRFRDTAWFERRAIPLFLGPNPSIFTPSDTPRTLAGGPIRLLHIGEMSVNKNQLGIVEALKALPSAFHVTFVFPFDNAYSAAVRSRISAARLDERVRYVVGQERQALEALYDTSDLLLISSGTEAQPITVSDALAKGMPFVSTPVGCMPAYRGGMIAEVAGFPATVQALADASRYSEFSAAALGFYHQMLSRERVKRTMDAMLAQFQ